MAKKRESGGEIKWNGYRMRKKKRTVNKVVNKWNDWTERDV